MSHLKYFGRAIWNGAWRPLAVSGEISGSASFCRLVLWLSEHIYLVRLPILQQGVPNMIMSWVRRYCFFCCCCSKCCLINSLLATFSCTLRSGDWLLSGPLPHVVLHLAGLLCSLSVLFIYFLSREVPIHAFLCKWSHIPGVAFPIPMQLSWDRQWVLQLPQRMGTKCLHEGEQHELSFHFTFFRELPASCSTLTLPMASSALMLSTTEVNRNFVVFRNCQRLSF